MPEFLYQWYEDQYQIALSMMPLVYWSMVVTLVMITTVFLYAILRALQIEVFPSLREIPVFRYTFVLIASMIFFAAMWALHLRMFYWIR